MLLLQVIVLQWLLFDVGTGSFDDYCVDDVDAGDDVDGVFVEDVIVCDSDCTNGDADVMIHIEMMISKQILQLIMSMMAVVGVCHCVVVTDA